MPLIIQAQDCSENNTPFSTYYHQRKSLFEILPDTDNEIIFLGDSITDGNNWTEMSGSLSVKNRGISGDGILGVICRIDEVLESHPAKVFLMIGTNDLARGMPVSQLLKYYEQLIGRFEQESPGTKLYVQSILPVNADFGMFESHMKSAGKIIKVNEQLGLLSEKYKVPFIDLYPSFATDQSKLAPNLTNDGLHLTGAGYQKWYSLIKNFIVD